MANTTADIHMSCCIDELQHSLELFEEFSGPSVVSAKIAHKLIKHMRVMCNGGDPSADLEFDACTLIQILYEAAVERLANLEGRYFTQWRIDHFKGDADLGPALRAAATLVDPSQHNMDLEQKRRYLQGLGLITRELQSRISECTYPKVTTSGGDEL